LRKLDAFCLLALNASILVGLGSGKIVKSGSKNSRVICFRGTKSKHQLVGASDLSPDEIPLFKVSLKGEMVLSSRISRLRIREMPFN